MSTLLIDTVVKGIPHQLKHNAKIDTGAISRTTRQFASDRTTYSYDTNPKIVVELPSAGHFDMQMSSLNYILAYPEGELIGSVHRLFRHVLLRGSDGRIWCETDNYDQLSSVLQDCTMNEYQRDHAFSILSLTGDSSRRQSAGKNGGTYVSIQPLLELLRYDRYLALHLTGKCTLEITLQDPRVCFKHNKPVPYTISNVVYRCDLVNFNPEVENMILSAWAADKLRYHFKQWKTQQYTSIAQNALLRIANPEASVNTLLVSVRKSSIVTKQDADSYERCFENLEEIAIDAGTNKIERINCRNGASQAFFELQKALDFSENVSITPDEWVSNKFILGQNLEVVTGNDDALAGYSGRGDIQVEFFRSQQPDEPLVYTCMMLSDQILCVGQNEGSRLGLVSA